jgi:predicted acyltransferase
MPGRDFPFMDQYMNMVSVIDRALMPGHLLLDSVAHNVRDPEGLLSNLPAVGTALLGLLTGMWLHSRKTPTTMKTAGLAIASAVCLALGYLWSLSFPLNKNMWTSSFVLVTAGWSLAILTLAYWVVEQKGWGKGKGNGWVYPWLVFGSNAITAYMFSELLPGVLWNIHFNSGGQSTNVLAWVAMHTVAHIPDPGLAAFAYSASFTAFCFLPVWILYRKKIFVKV